MANRFWNSFDRGLEQILRWGAIFCLVCLLLLIAATVFVRFVPVSSMGWSDEIIEFAFAWMVFLGTAWLWRNRTHFRVELITGWLAGSKSGQVLEIVLNLLALVFFLVFTYQGWILSGKATDRSPILELPRYLWYIIMPLSGLIIIGYTLRDLRDFFRGRSR